MSNKIFSFIFALTVSLFLFSCSGEKQQKTVHEEFVGSLTAADTTEIKNLCDAFFTQMKEGNKDGAFELLYMLGENNQVEPVSVEYKAKISTQFTIFPVRDFRSKEIRIGNAEDNIASYTIVFGQDAEGKESTISFGFNPVKVNGKWYLTVRNASAQLED